MLMDEIRGGVQEVLRSLFDDAHIELRDEMTAGDFGGWDSYMHLNVVIALETHFKIKFATAEISRIMHNGENIGTLLALIQKMLSNE